MPPTITVHFDPDGDPLTALVRAGFANPGSYGLTLLGPGGAPIVQQFTADFGTPSDNTHALGRASQHDGRVLDLIASVGLLDASKAYSVFLTVLQGGRELGTVGDVGTGSGVTKVVELIVMLSGVPAGAAAGAGLAVTRGGRRAGKLPSRVARRAAVKKRAKRVIDAAKRAARAVTTVAKETTARVKVAVRKKKAAGKVRRVGRRRS